MTINVEERIAKLDPVQRQKVEERAAELIAEEMTLRELRKARQLTQAHVATELGISQDGVSRLEHRSDLLLSTLRKTVEAMGGSLTLVARFPDHPPVELSGIATGTLAIDLLTLPTGAGFPPGRRARDARRACRR